MCARVPQRLEHRVGEAQREQVLHRFLAEIMVDAEDALLGEGRGDRVVDLAAGFEVGAERLLERHADLRAGQARGSSPSMVGLNRDGAVDRKIATPSLGSPTRLGEPANCGRLRDVERHIVQPRQESLGDLGIVEALGQIFSSAASARARNASSSSSVRAVPMIRRSRRAAARRHRARKATAAASARARSPVAPNSSSVEAFSIIARC